MNSTLGCACEEWPTDGAKAPETAHNKMHPRRQGKALVSIASWAPQKASVKLAIDWKALGLDPGKATIMAPPIDKFQDAKTFAADDEIPVEPGKGWLLIIQ